MSNVSRSLHLTTRRRGPLHRAVAVVVGVALGTLAALTLTGAQPRNGSELVNPDRHLPRPGVQVALGQPSKNRIYLPLSLRHVTRDDLPDPHRVTPVPTEPATANPSPTDEPTPTHTVEPSATPTATQIPPSPTPTQVPLVCEQHVPNFDFEAGPRQWTLIVTNTEQQVSRSIQPSARVPVRPTSGDYLAWLGGLPSTMFRLTSDPFNIDTTDMISASLRFNIALMTEESWDRRDDDVVAVRLGAGSRFTEVPDLRLSEETLPGGGRWRTVVEDVTSMVQGGSVRALDLRVDTSGARNSWFYFDDVTLTTCHRRLEGFTGQAGPVPNTSLAGWAPGHWPLSLSGPEGAALRPEHGASKIRLCCRLPGPPWLCSRSRPACRGDCAMSTPTARSPWRAR